jgi:hypothetical protein
MRIIMLAVAMLLGTAMGARAQSGPVEPRPMVGGGLVYMSDGGDVHRRGVSGIYEVPLYDDLRIRVEAARFSWPFHDARAVSSADPTYPGHVAWMTISGARVITPQLPGSYYAGGGVGVYRVSRDRAEVRAGLHGYVGAELRLDRVHVAGEIFVHLPAFDPGFNPPAVGGALRIMVAP